MFRLGNVIWRTIVYAAKVLYGRLWHFPANNMKNFIFSPPLLTFAMFLACVSGGGIASGNGIYLYLSTFHPGAISTSLRLVMGTFCIYTCVFWTLRPFLLFRPRVFPRALGPVARREPARTP